MIAQPKRFTVREADSFGPSLRVPRARILSVRRADPFRISVGDWAEAELSPEVLQFFSLKDPQRRAWCEGYASEWTLPIAVAAVAAYAVLEPVSCPGLNAFSGITKSFRWKRPWQPEENLLAATRLLRVGRTSATVEYRTLSRERKDLIFEGSEVFVSVFGNPPKPVPIRLSSASETPPAQPQESPSSPEPETGVAALLQGSAPRQPARISEQRCQSLDGKVLIYPIQIEKMATGQQANIEVELPQFSDGRKIERVTVCRHGQKVASLDSIPSGMARISFVPQSREGYELSVETREGSPLLEPENRVNSFVEQMETGTTRYREFPESPSSDIFHLRPTRLLSKSVSNPNEASEGDAWEWLVPADLLKLLGNPVAGNREPLGRRLHPYGLLSVAIPIRAAQQLFGPVVRPSGATIRYFRPVHADSDFKHRMVLRSVQEKELILDSELQQADFRVATLTLTLEISV